MVLTYVLFPKQMDRLLPRHDQREKPERRYPADLKESVLLESR